MDSGCIQIHSRNTKVERARESKLKDVDRKIKENNDNVWRVTPKEQCGQIVHKVERWRQRSNECGMMD